MKVLLLFLFITSFLFVDAQQTPRYTQYTLNNLGGNPAYAGANPMKLEVMSGRRNQWYGFEHAPVTTFFSVNYGYRGTYSYKGWHGFSAYVEEDKVGAITNKQAYLGYAYHFRIITRINIGFGLMAGVRSFGLSSATFNAADPAFTQTKAFIYTYPDFIPGMRIYSKKMFIDFSIKQLYKNKMAQGSKQIGNSGKLPPHYYLTIGRKIHLGYNNFIMTPTVHIQSNLLSIPQVDAGVMFYYKKRIGIGTNYRVGNSFSGIVQVNIYKSIVAGFSYDYTANRFRNAAANTYEFIIGISPVMSDDSDSRKRNVAQCPTFDF